MTYFTPGVHLAKERTNSLRQPLTSTCMHTCSHTQLVNQLNVITYLKRNEFLGVLRLGVHDQGIHKIKFWRFFPHLDKMPAFHCFSHGRQEVIILQTHCESMNCVKRTVPPGSSCLPKVPMPMSTTVDFINGFDEMKVGTGGSLGLAVLPAHPT